MVINEERSEGHEITHNSVAMISSTGKYNNNLASNCLALDLVLGKCMDTPPIKSNFI